MIDPALIKAAREAADGPSGDAEHDAFMELLDAIEREPAPKDTTYSGWTNYETWVVGMFLDGNYTGEDTYLEVLGIARSAPSTGKLADELKEYLTESIWPENVPATIGSDLLKAALSEVDWHELAEQKIREVSEND